MNIYEAWARSYLVNREDPHQEFAERLGITRNEAKVECYKLMFSSQFMKGFVENVQSK